MVQHATDTISELYHPVSRAIFTEKYKADFLCIFTIGSQSHSLSRILKMLEMNIQNSNATFYSA